MQRRQSCCPVEQPCFRDTVAPWSHLGRRSLRRSANETLASQDTQCTQGAISHSDFRKERTSISRRAQYNTTNFREGRTSMSRGVRNSDTSMYLYCQYAKLVLLRSEVGARALQHAVDARQSAHDSNVAGKLLRSSHMPRLVCCSGDSSALRFSRMLGFLESSSLS